MRGEKKWLASDGKTELRPGMLVLARYYDDEKWWVNVLSHCDRLDYCCIDGRGYPLCLPLAGNESLAGTDAPIPEPRQDAPQPDKSFKWGELVWVWDDNLDDKLNALFVRELASLTYPYEVLERGGTCLTQWKHCERI